MTGCASTPRTWRSTATPSSVRSEANAAGEHVMEYNARKEPVIRAIYDRAFRAWCWFVVYLI